MLSGHWEYWAVLDLPEDDFDISKANRKDFGVNFIPDLLKYFNHCGEVYTSRQLWWKSNLFNKSMMPNNTKIHKKNC